VLHITHPLPINYSLITRLLPVHWHFHWQHWYVGASPASVHPELCSQKDCADPVVQDNFGKQHEAWKGVRLIESETLAG
jgi:hypothetical protein